MAKVNNALELRLEEPATPERVEAVARLFRELLATACPTLADGAVTMVIRNYSTGAGVRPRSKKAEKAVQQVLKFFDQPEAPRRPKHRDFAGHVAEFLRDVHPDERAVIYVPGTKIQRARKVGLDKKFSDAVDAILAAPDPDEVRGTTLVRSRVLRVGRSDPARPVHARIVIEDANVDVPIRGDASPYFDAAKSSAECDVTLDAVWSRARSTLTLLPKRCVAIAIEPATQPASGATALDALDHAFEGSPLQTMSADEFLEVIRELRGG